MLFSRLLPCFFLGLFSFTLALPLKQRELKVRAFVEQAYADFQISDGEGGNAQAEAAADERDAVQAMREAAESAETEDFNPQIKAASGADADALSVGKIKNKVLKLTGEVQVLNIDIAKAKAAGKDTSSLTSKLKEEQTKLTKNIKTDTDSAGKASKGVA